MDRGFCNPLDHFHRWVWGSLSVRLAWRVFCLFSTRLQMDFHPSPNMNQSKENTVLSTVPRSPPCTCRTRRLYLITEPFLFVEPQNSPRRLLKFTLEPSLDSLLSYLYSFLSPLFWLVELSFLSLVWDDRKEMCALSGSANFFCLRKHNKWTSAWGKKSSPVLWLNLWARQMSSDRFVMHWENDGFPKLLSNLCLRGFFYLFFFKTSDVFPHGCFLWKAGTPWPRQHNRCFSWLRGRGREGEGSVAFSIWSLSALVRQSDVKE